MKVFIENEAGSNKKNIFDEQTLVYRKTHIVSASYPFPYGFILNTTSGDDGNLDCFVLTKQSLKSGEIVEAEPVGMFEDIEDGKEDHKILAVLKGESWTVDENIQNLLRNFSLQVFSHIPNKQKTIERFLDAESARTLLQSASMSPATSAASPTSPS